MLPRFGAARQAVIGQRRAQDVYVYWESATTGGCQAPESAPGTCRVIGMVCELPAAAADRPASDVPGGRWTRQASCPSASFSKSRHQRGNVGMHLAKHPQRDPGLLTHLHVVVPERVHQRLDA